MLPAWAAFSPPLQALRREWVPEHSHFPERTQIPCPWDHLRYLSINVSEAHHHLASRLSQFPQLSKRQHHFAGAQGKRLGINSVSSFFHTHIWPHQLPLALTSKWTPESTQLSTAVIQVQIAIVTYQGYYSDLPHSAYFPSSWSQHSCQKILVKCGPDLVSHLFRPSYFFLSHLDAPYRPQQALCDQTVSFHLWSYFLLLLLLLLIFDLPDAPGMD